MPDEIPGNLAPAFFAQRPRLLVLTLVAMFAVATGLRLQHLEAPGMLVDRDYTSAMFARAFYLPHVDDVPAWRRRMATELMTRQPTLEPPVTEWLASVLYRVAGREDMRLGRLLTISFWMLGGALFFLLARRLAGVDAALVALGYYLFLPLTILLSRSFQPDALMMLMFVASLLAIVRWHQGPSTRGLATAAILSALTLVYRPLVVPALVAAFVFPAIQSEGWRRGLIGRTTLAYTAVATLPALAYYGYASFIARTFHWKLGSSFMFSLYGRSEFWVEWCALATSQLGLVALVLALAGLPFLRSPVTRPLVVGLGVGYVAFGLAFTYHIHTHGYYHAQLIPAVALALGAVTVPLIRKAWAAPERWLRLAPMAAAGLVAMSWISTLRADLGRQVFESPAVAAEIGARVQHSDRVVFLSPFYGLPLQYLGEFTGAYWPRRMTYELYRREGERERSVSERLSALGFVPEYFVITHFREYAAHHGDLRALLDLRCSPLAITEAYHLYGRCDLTGSLERREDARGARTMPGPAGS